MCYWIITTYVFFSQFPKFWSTVEIEEDPDDLLEAKSLLTVLGYTTKIAVSTITVKKFAALQIEYAKVRSNKFQDTLLRFPALKNIDSNFTPGMKTILLEIAANLSQKPKPEDLEALIKNKVLRQVKRVCFLLLRFRVIWNCLITILNY